MKRTKRKLLKFIAVLLCVLFVLPPYSLVASDTVAESKEVLLQNALQQYFDSRCIVDTEQMCELLDGIAEQGMINDALQRISAIAAESISVVSNSFSVASCSFFDNEGIVVVTETLTYSVFGAKLTDSIIHYVTFGYTDDYTVFLLLSDGYYESVLQFESCAYLSTISSTTDSVARTTSTEENDFPTGDYAYDIVKIAEAELGYLEKDERTDNLDDKTEDGGSGNFTKYGRWYGWNGDAWCSIFVAWCANQAGVSTSVIPKNTYGRVREKRTFFINAGLYYDSQSKGGTYIPKIGDLFFTYNAAKNQYHICGYDSRLVVSQLRHIFYPIPLEGD